MKCPKCGFINQHGATECDDCGVQFVDIRAGRGAARQDKIDRTCPWNDHGNICGLVGSLSDTTNGQGPWYCAKHFWRLKGWPAKAGAGAPTPYRDRWHQEHPDEPQHPPNLAGTAHLRPLAAGGSDLYERLFAGQLGPAKPQRQPGEE